MGMSLVAVLPNPKRKAAHIPVDHYSADSWVMRLRRHIASFGPVNHRGVVIISVIDVISQLIGVAGLFLAGSGLYMVNCNSLPSYVFSTSSSYNRIFGCDSLSLVLSPTSSSLFLL